MKARDVVGRKIVAIHQEKIALTPSRACGYVFRVIRIELDDGTVIVPSVVELEEDDHAVAMDAIKPKGRTTP